MIAAFAEQVCTIMSNLHTHRLVMFGYVRHLERERRLVALPYRGVIFHIQNFALRLSENLRIVHTATPPPNAPTLLQCFFCRGQLDASLENYVWSHLASGCHNS